MANVGGKFESFIFLDMETTGLTRPIEITELSFVAIHKRHFLPSEGAVASEHEVRMPRIYDKLHLCVRPLQEIEQKASGFTGITDDDLINKKPFDKQLACMIRAFCLRQPQPACLVAHWGDRYDFNILASQFTKVGLKFPSSIPISDSHKAFKKLHKAAHGKTKGVSFSLLNLYQREMGRYIKGQYTVEGDSMALIELVIKNPKVLEYIERGAKTLGRGESNQSRPRKRRKTDFVDLTTD